MRRSLCPSQTNNPLRRLNNEQNAIIHNDNNNISDKDTVTISRLPLFGFLEIPASLNKQFKLPSGCTITEK